MYNTPEGLNELELGLLAPGKDQFQEDIVFPFKTDLLLKLIEAGTQPVVLDASKST